MRGGIEPLERLVEVEKGKSCGNLLKQHLNRKVKPTKKKTQIKWRKSIIKERRRKKKKKNRIEEEQKGRERAEGKKKSRREVKEQKGRRRAERKKESRRKEEEQKEYFLFKVKETRQQLTGKWSRVLQRKLSQKII